MMGGGWSWRLMARTISMYGAGRPICVGSVALSFAARRCFERQPLSCVQSRLLLSPTCLRLVYPELSAAVVARAATDADKSGLEGGGAADLDELPASVAPAGGMQLEAAVDDHLGSDQSTKAFWVELTELGPFGQV